MSTQRYQGQFRSVQGLGGGPPINMVDAFPVATTAGWTPGCTLREQLQLQPLVGRAYVVQAFSVQGQVILINQNPTKPMAGKLGRLFASLQMLGGSRTNGGGTNFPAPFGSTAPYNVPVESLPADTTLGATVWDGQRDASPPISSGFPTTAPTQLQVSQTVELPLPIVLRASDTISLGLWLTPSLFSGAPPDSPLLSVLNASYTIVYDDGNAAS